MVNDKIGANHFNNEFKITFNKNNKSNYKSFESDKGKIIGDFQEKIEKDWIDELKFKYTVSINKKALRKLKKRYINE